MAKQLQTDFSDEEMDEQTAPAKALPAVERDESGTPYCAKHHCRMKITTSGKAGSLVAYFKCPVEGCEEKGKRVKPCRSVIPADPHTCPRCPTHPIMERDVRISSMSYTILKCPVCGHKSAPMPRPELVAQHEMARKPLVVEDIGSR